MMIWWWTISTLQPPNSMMETSRRPRTRKSPIASAERQVMERWSNAITAIAPLAGSTTSAWVYHPTMWFQSLRRGIVPSVVHSLRRINCSLCYFLIVLFYCSLLLFQFCVLFTPRKQVLTLKTLLIIITSVRITLTWTKRWWNRAGNIRVRLLIVIKIHILILLAAIAIGTTTRSIQIGMCMWRSSRSTLDRIRVRLIGIHSILMSIEAMMSFLNVINGSRIIIRHLYFIRRQVTTYQSFEWWMDVEVFGKLLNYRIRWRIKKYRLLGSHVNRVNKKSINNSLVQFKRLMREARGGNALRGRTYS